MAYEINAWVENGAPRLQILDADSHSVRLAWRGGDKRDSTSLFRELLLLSLMQQLQQTGQQT